MGELPIGLLIVTMASLALAGILRQWASRLRDARNVDPAPVPATHLALTVVVPVRNEADQLPACLQDLYAQTMRDRMQVLVVDDHSTDASPALVRAMAERWSGLELVPLSNGQGKKAALLAGVRQARHPVILCSDGDTRCGPRRAHVVLGAFAEAPVEMVLLPVAVSRAPGWCARFQYEEQCALLGVAAGSGLAGRPLLANGANMAFSRQAYLREAPRMAGAGWASGDDMFLLAAMVRAGAPIGYVFDRDALVEVAPQPGWSDWWSQRLRWSGKMRAFPAAGTLFVAAIALAIPWVLAWCTVDLMGRQVGEGLLHGVGLLLLAWAAWTFPILGLVAEVKRFLGHRTAPLITLVALLQFAVVAPVIALLSIFVRPRWKGRRIR